MNNVNHWNRIFYFSIFCLVVVLVVFGAIGYDQNMFWGDGFVHYTAVRNFVDGLGIQAGPAHERYFATHAHFTLFLLAPIVAIFRSPSVMVYASIACWLASTLMFFEVCREIWRQKFPSSGNQSVNIIPALLGICYATFPIGLHFALSTDQMFEPDFMFPAALLLSFLALLRKNYVLFVGAFVFLLLIKEEYLASFPFCFLWMVACYSISIGRSWLSRRQIVGIGLVYTICAVAIVGIILFNRARSTFCFIDENNPVLFDIHHLLNWDQWKWLPFFLKYAWINTFSLVPLWIWILWKGTKESRQVIGLTFLLAIVFRELLAFVLYHMPSVPIHHTRVFLAPTLFTGTALALASLLATRKVPMRSAFLAIGVTLVLNIVAMKVRPIQPLLVANDILRHPETARRHNEQFELIRKAISATGEPLGKAVLLSVTTNSAFGSELDGVHPPTFFRHYELMKKHLKYGIVDKFSVSEDYIGKGEEAVAKIREFRQDYKVLLETDDYLFVRRK